MRLIYVVAFLLAAVVASLVYRSTTIEGRLDDDCPTTNWEGRYLFNAPVLLRPEHIDDVVEGVKETRRRGGNLTIIGSGHSWSDIAVPTEAAMCMRSYHGLVSVDVDRRLATFKAGTTLEQITEELSKHGLALENLPSVSEQTIAGALATGTHGTGVTYCNLPSKVVSLQLVTGEGEILTVSRTENADIFDAVTVSLGMLGVVTEVTLQVVPLFNLRERTQRLPLTDVLRDLDSIARSADRVKLWVEVHSGVALVFRSESTDEEPRDNTLRWVADLKMRMFEALQWMMAYVRPITAAAMKICVHYLDAFPEIDRVDVSQNVLNIPHHIALHPEAEVSVPIENCTKAIRTLQDVVQEMGMGINFINEVRFVRGDKSWMSPDYGHDTCHISILLYAQEDCVLDYFYTLEERLLPLGARQHWAKMFKSTEKELKSLYAKWDDFMAVKKRLDPSKVFCNEYSKRVFPSVC